VFASTPPQKCVGLFVIYGVLASNVSKPKPKCFMTPLFSSQIQINKETVYVEFFMGMSQI
jgi:hypothetical protein